MSGSETAANQKDQLVLAIRSLLIAGMMACVIVSLVGLVRRIVPYWPGQYLIPLAFFTCLEGIATERLLQGHSFRLGGKIKLRVAEWVIIMVALRLILSLLGGWTNLVHDASRWLANPAAIFDLAFLATGLILLAVWQTSIFLARDLLILETSPADDPAPAITSDEYWIWITRPRNRPDTQAATRHLSSTFLWGGVLLLLFSGLAHLDLQLLVRLEHASTPGIILNALVYFLLGLALLSQAHFAALHSQWLGEEIEVGPRIGPRWAVLGLASVSAVALVAILLPTNYSAGLLQALHVGATRIFTPILRVLMWLLSAVLLVLAYILRFLFGSDVAPRPPSAPPRLSLPQEVPAPGGGGLAWFELLRTLVFWVVLAWIVGYSSYQYFRQRSDLWSKLKRVPLLGWLTDLWKALFHGSRHLVARAREGLRAALELISSRVTVPDLPWRFISLRSLTKRELVRYFYLSTVRRAGQAGRPRGPSQTPYEYQEALEKHVPSSEADVALLTQAFVEARYDVREFSPEEANVVKQAWQRVKALLREAKKDRDGTRPSS